MGAEWPEWRDEQLRTLRDDGLSTRVIGERLGMSKNAVVGRVHRLGLTPRKSPLAADSPSRYRPVRMDSRRKSSPPNKIKRAPAITLEQLPSAPQPPRTEPILAPHAIQPMRLVPTPGPVGKCQFLSGDKRPWVFCDKPTSPGKPYCRAHCKRCYQPLGTHIFRPATRASVLDADFDRDAA